MNNRYTICAFSANSPGVLLRITGLFTRRKLNIESLTVSETERAGISRFTIVVEADRELCEKVARQIRRIIEVSDCYVCENSELVFKEVALFKVRGESAVARLEIGKIADQNGGRVVFVDDLHIVVEKSGDEVEIKALYREFEPFGIKEFVRSGRIALLKHEKPNEKGSVVREEDGVEEALSMF